MTVTVRACAKVNLHLDILDRRDDGYHNLETVFQEIDLADQLVVSISDIDSDQLTVRNAPEVPADGRNLVLKAVAGLRKHLAGKLPFLSVGLTKHIPDGAGLGGGSSDAAAVLLAVRQLCEPDITDADLERVALSIGSDCAFFLHGGTQTASGRGERLSPLQCSRDFHILIVVPDCYVSTAEAYGALRPEELGLRTDLDALRQWIAGDDIVPLPRNTFQAGARLRSGAVDDALSALKATRPVFSLLSGSGAGCFAVYNTAKDAERAAETMPSTARLVRVCRPVSR